MRTVSQNSAGTLNPQTSTSDPIPELNCPGQALTTPPFAEAGSNQPATTQTMEETNESSANTCPRYSLRKGLGYWQLTFAGEEAIFKHEKGTFYACHLLLNPPPEPIHGLALYLQVGASIHRSGGPLSIEDPITGRRVTVDDDARLQEQSLAIEEAESAAALRRKQLQLEAILDDEDTLEPEREEVTRELLAIYNFQKSNPRKTTDAAQKAVRSVRMAIKRFHSNLANSVDAYGQPDRVLRAFADHLHKHLIVPSSRFSHPQGNFARTGIAGCFTYEPPPGVVWEG